MSWQMNWNSKWRSMFLLVFPLLGCLFWLRIIKKSVIDLRVSFQQTLLHQIALHRVEWSFRNFSYQHSLDHTLIGWVFFDLFKASVDSNSHLSNSEKLNNSNACVKGEAARLISSISITDANYNIALTLLKDRYEKKRSIIPAHLQALWSQPVLKTESALRLRKLMELTN